MAQDDAYVCENRDEIAARLDPILKYHVDMILSYAERTPLDKLHAKYDGDPVFEIFGLTDLEFTKKRWQAGLANSCATNLGRFTDKAAKIILESASGLSTGALLKSVTISANDVVETEETDGVVLLSEVDERMAPRLEKATARLNDLLQKPFDAKGIGFEFRGRYGKNDDTLLQKDEHMAEAIRQLGAVPVMGTFSTSNAAGAMRRLARTWVIVQGHETVELLNELTGFHLVMYLKKKTELLSPIKAMLIKGP